MHTFLFYILNVQKEFLTIFAFETWFCLTFFYHKTILVKKLIIDFINFLLQLQRITFIYINKIFSRKYIRNISKREREKKNLCDVNLARAFVHFTARTRFWPDYSYIYIKKSRASGKDVPRTTAELYLGSGFKMMAVLASSDTFIKSDIHKMRAKWRTFSHSRTTR